MKRYSRPSTELLPFSFWKEIACPFSSPNTRLKMVEVTHPYYGRRHVRRRIPKNAIIGHSNLTTLGQKAFNTVIRISRLSARMCLHICTCMSHSVHIGYDLADDISVAKQSRIHRDCAYVIHRKLYQRPKALPLK